MKKKSYIDILQNKALAHSRLKYILIFVNWILQGLWYSDKTERDFKIFIDLILTLFFFLILMNFVNVKISIILAFIIAHTFNWLCNHHFWALMLEVSGIGKTPPKKICDYAKALKDRATEEKSILCVAIYGSLCRGELRESSDLDVRIIRRPGVINGVRACSFGLTENARAFFCKFPLDLHVVDSTKHLSKLREDEMPVVLYDPEGILKKLYPKATYLNVP